MPPPTHTAPPAAGHTGPALQVFCRGRCPHRPVRTPPNKAPVGDGVLDVPFASHPMSRTRRAGCSCCGAQNFYAALRRTLKILTAATRSSRFFRHWRRSIRSPHPAADMHRIPQKPVIANRRARRCGNPSLFFSPFHPKNQTKNYAKHKNPKTPCE